MKTSILRGCRSAALVLFSQLSGCVEPPPPHSPNHFQCLQYCSTQKDACMLQATTANAIQQCDGQSFQCAQRCPY